MAKRNEKERMSSYTQRERQELTKQFNKVLRKCPDRTFGRAVAAAAKAIKAGT